MYPQGGLRMGRNIHHVVPRGEKWVVRREDSDKPTKIFSSKRKAIGYAYDRAANNKGYIAIHSKTGEIDKFKSAEETNKIIQMLIG